MRSNKLFTILIASACADPSTENSETEGITSNTLGDEGDVSDSDSTENGTEDTTEGHGDTDDTDDTDETDETGNPPGNPGPGDPCNPFLAAEGVAPCEDPDGLSSTCAIVMLMPDIDTTVFEFRCLPGGLAEMGDDCVPTTEGGMHISAHCQNAFCLWNGLGNDPMNDEPWGFPPGECPFEIDEGIYSFSCCASYCDADHPCDLGWTCQMGAPAVSQIPEGTGACVWL